MRDWYAERRDGLVAEQEHCPKMPGMADDASLKGSIMAFDSALNVLGEARSEGSLERLAHVCCSLLRTTLDTAIHSGIDLRACMEHGVPEGLRVGRPAEREAEPDEAAEMAEDLGASVNERPRYEYKLLDSDGDLNEFMIWLVGYANDGWRPVLMLHADVLLLEREL